MRRDENDQEDLMKEAVSLVKRIEFRYPAEQQPVVLGFNSLGWLFVYLGDDPMYRFDELGRLRRAFVDGKLFRTGGHTLAMMDRQKDQVCPERPSMSASILLRRDLSAEELDAFRVRVRRELEELSDGLCHGELTRQYPPDEAGLILQFEQAIKNVLASRVFLAPPIVRR